ncbi:serine/threonine-protein kinase [Sorangium sp. So ce327]|uniref:serine/threonine-protein kinase n=1 Tax=Sorangium sp. So ce327 TaxID=3133301 RepID=UPI003F63F2E3
MSSQEETREIAELELLLAGARVGPYVIEQPLASGGFGVVYQAAHVESRAPAALKILHTELAADAEAVARFDREVTAVRRIRHPHVIEVLDHGRLDDGRSWLAMPLLRGVSLREHLAMRGCLSVEEACAILAPLCDAVAAAHAEGVLHRDIKASNVFLDEAGPLAPGSPRVVLLDFGVAKLLDGEGPRLTTSRHMVGSLCCMAPEQILCGPVDERSDVYALGVLAYRLLTGRPPFSTTSSVALYQMHLYTVPPPLTLSAQVSAALNAAVLRALSKEPEERPPTPQAFLAEIRAATSQQRSSTEGLALGVHVEARLAEGAPPEEPGEEAMADLEAIVPAARAAFEPLGLRVALLTGSGALLALPCAGEAVADAGARRRVMEAVIAFTRRIEGRARRSPWVEVRISVHIAEARIGGGGTVEGGPITRLTWVPEVAAAGPLASDAALAGMDLPAQELGEVAGIVWLDLGSAEAQRTASAQAS